MKNKFADRSFWAAIASGITLLISSVWPIAGPISAAIVEPVIIEAGCKATDCDGSKAAADAAKEAAILEAIKQRQEARQP